MSRKTLRVSKIRDGTVIDHITRGHALDVLRILGITGREGSVVTVAMNVPSGKLGVKDMVKVEGRELNSREAAEIALLAPGATINIIRNYRVAEKQRVKLPELLKGVVRCANPACVSNSDEPIQPTFYVEHEEPLRLRCHYCGYIMEREEVLKQF